METVYPGVGWVILLAACLGGLFCGSLSGESRSAEEIMRRVAEGQDRAVEARRRFVYRQMVRARVFGGNGKKLRHELTREFLIVPSADGLDRQLVKEHGRKRRKDKLQAYDDRGAIKRGLDFDLAESLADDLILGNSRDGIEEELFPLTSKAQKDFRFRLAGTEEYKGSDVYKVLFEPKERWDSLWEGEALIDAREFQPVLVVSHMSPTIPRWVRWIFGVNIRQLGFKVTYQKFAEGVWFPSTLGGEFEIRILHFYKRKASTLLVNSDFKKTAVDSKVQFEQVGSALAPGR